MEGTPIGKLGKFGLIDHIGKKARKENISTLYGIGDDSAVIDAGGELVLVSTDLFLEGIHFNLIYSPLKHLGYKAVIRGISDIYAMNGIPHQVFIAVGLSSRFTVEMVDEIYEGIRLACDKYKVDLAGGDTTSSLTGLTISATTTGSVKKERLVRRSGAGPADLICVTGDFGASYMGLQLLERERRLFEKDRQMQPDLAGYEYVVGRQLKPEFPKNVLEEMNSEGLLPTSMIDVSDGLASDLMHVCKMSGTGCRIYAEKIPVDTETARVSEEFSLDPMTPALNGGEDYELLFTLPVARYQEATKLENTRIIGHMTPAGEGYVLVGSGNTVIPLAAQGWNAGK